MSKILLVMSHIGSGSDRLFNILQEHPVIDGFKTDIIYDHPDALKLLRANVHKCDNAAAVWMDELLHNYRLTCKPLCRTCKLVFLIGEPRSSIERICKTYHPEDGLRYYQFRLQGMLEYIARTPGSVILTWPRIQAEGLQVLERYLGLREPLGVPQPPEKPESLLPLEILQQAEAIHEKLTYQLKALEKRAEGL